MATSPRQLVSLIEAAEILAVSVKTVRRYIAAGDLEAVRLGRAHHPDQSRVARPDDRHASGEHVEESERMSSLNLSTSNWAPEPGLPVIDCVPWPNRPTSSIW